MVLVAVLCALFVPVWPGTYTDRVELRTQEVRNASMLLGEGGETAEKPPEVPPSTGGITLTVPKLGLSEVPVPTGSRQAELDRTGLLRVRGSGLPWREGSNTFIAGHALGFPWTRVPRAFHDLDTLMPGDEVFVEGADGRRYAFRVYDRMTVEPDDTWVTYPVEDRTVVSLQTCTPIPTFENRLIVRAELVS